MSPESATFDCSWWVVHLVEWSRLMWLMLWFSKASLGKWSMSSSICACLSVWSPSNILVVWSSGSQAPMQTRRGERCYHSGSVVALWYNFFIMPSVWYTTVGEFRHWWADYDFHVLKGILRKLFLHPALAPQDVPAISHQFCTLKHVSIVGFAAYIEMSTLWYFQITKP